MSSSDKAPRQKSRGEVASSRVLSGRSEVETFLQKVAATPAPARQAGTRGRLIFALDATASRQPTWDRAMHLQGEMFHEASRLGGLDIQLVFYRGFGECKASRWHSDGKTLLRAMTAVNCLAGQTQIARVLRHAIKETKQRRVDALVFIGDCVEEDVDELGTWPVSWGCWVFPVLSSTRARIPRRAPPFNRWRSCLGARAVPLIPILRRNCGISYRPSPSTPVAGARRCSISPSTAAAGFRS